MSASEEAHAPMSASEETHAPMRPADDFLRASTAIEAMIAAVRPEQWDAPTPCTEWNLRQLVNHLVEVNYSLAARFGGQIGRASCRERV